MSDFHLGSGVLSCATLFKPYVCEKKVGIITHDSLAALYVPSLFSACEAAGAKSIQVINLPEGESTKTLATAESVWNTLLTHQFDRDSLLIALGGGVIGDLTGFCGACFHRGIDVLQCPTTFLAQIDASIGGKTAVNHPLAKNVIGAFHLPLAIIIDTDTLKTLPEAEYVAGLGELIKYGMACDANFFEWIEKNMTLLMKKEPKTITYAIRRAYEIKSHIVAEDEKDKGLRAILNFGHTVGHAIESALHYKEWRHGEAVGVGMIVATHLAWQQGNVPKSLLDKLIGLLKQANLPVMLPDSLSIPQLLSKMVHDKKHSQGAMRWVLLKGLGEAYIESNVTRDQIIIALTYCKG